MVKFQVELLRFGAMGEKTGWTFLEISKETADQIKAGCRKSYRVKGKIDEVSISGVAIIPMGEGIFIMPLKASLRKKLRKEEGDRVMVELEEDKDFKIDLPEDLEICLAEEQIWLERFLAMAKSHQHYFINWINSAKTEPTRTRRIALTVEAMEKQLNFGEMMRMDKARRQMD